MSHWCESWHLYGFCFLLGDGGNDVSMIQEADCGVGVEGKVRLSPSHCLTLTCLSHRFLLCVSCQDLSHVQRYVEGRSHRWFLFMRIYCLSRGNKDDRMLCAQVKVSICHHPASCTSLCVFPDKIASLLRHGPHTVHVYAVILPKGFFFFDILGNSLICCFAKS